MKNTSLILAIIILFSLSNCVKSKEDTSESDANGDVWKLSTVIVDTPIDLYGSGTSSIILFDAESDSNLAKSELVLNNQTNGSLLLTQEWVFSTYYQGEELKYAVMSSTNDEVTPIPINYSLNEFNEGTITINNETSILTVSDTMLLIKKTNGFVARDITTSEVTQTQDLTYVFHKK